MTSTNTTTAGAEALAFIQNAIAAGRTVYISTMTTVTAVTPRTVAAWDKAGRPLFKLINGDLFIGSGKRYDKLTAGDLRLVGITTR